LHGGSINRTPTGYKGGEEYFARKYFPDLLRRYVGMARIKNRFARVNKNNGDSK
jgi:hypothetical protein